MSFIESREQEAAGLSSPPTDQIVATNFFKLIVCTIVFLFWILVNIATALFGILNNRALKINSLGMLKTWKADHELVCRLANKINRCFGPTVLFAICNGCVGFITNTYAFVAVLMKYKNPFVNGGDSYLWIVIIQATSLVILIHASYRFKFEVGEKLTDDDGDDVVK